VEAELAAAAPGPAGAPTAGRRVIAGVLGSILNWPTASHTRYVHNVVARLCADGVYGRALRGRLRCGGAGRGRPPR
jgi:hypothetical protein